MPSAEENAQRVRDMIAKRGWTAQVQQGACERIAAWLHTAGPRETYRQWMRRPEPGRPA